MQAVHAKRLLKLAAFLQELPKSKFDFGTFVHRGAKPMLEALKARRSRCGSVACAVGWMPAVFPRHVRWVGSDVDGGNLQVTLRDEDYYGYNFDVAEVFFGLSYDETRDLFNPDNGSDDSLPFSATPKQVAGAIRRFVREKRSA